MSPEQYRLARTFLDRVLELPSGEREPLLAGIRGTDLEVAAEVQSLLAAYGDGRVFLGDTVPHIRLSETGTPGLFKPGALVAGRFRLIRCLGTGGMGEVYEAEDRELGRIALKIIRPDVALRPGMAAAFRREVQLARRVANPHVCRIHELLFSPAYNGNDGPAFLTMQFVDGITLDEHIARDGPLPYKMAHEIAYQLCDGLAAIHAAGIIHADLKARNVMLSRCDGDYRAVIMDFGIAREMQTAAVAAAASGSGFAASAPQTAGFLGTPESMAPEQFEHGALTPATDIYALGELLYEMVTGKRPFAADSVLSTAVRRAKSFPPPSRVVPGLPHRWDTVIQCCLQYEANDRYQSASEVWRGLSSGPVTLAYWKDASRKAAKRPRILVATGISVIALLAAVVFLIRARAYIPPSPEAQQWFDSGVAAVREGTYLKAASALQEAVHSDDNFAMAHARLAEAFNELDRENDAKNELLKALTPERTKNLPHLHRLYLDAIRATVLHDADHALATYREILDQLPVVQKPSGYVDLGRAFEKSGNVAQAVASYWRAMSLDSRLPAAYLRLGVLEFRQNHLPQADAALRHAAQLYRLTSNAEGLAEVQYQRGYGETLQYQFEEARHYLEDALRTAEELDNPAMQARILCRLSVTEYLRDHEQAAVAYAERAIAIAHRAGNAYLEADARIRIANAHAYNRAFQGVAEQYATDALHDAQRNDWRVLQANANMTLSMLRLQQSRPSEALPLARTAYDFYNGAGYFVDSTVAMFLMIRSRTNMGDYKQAMLLAGEANAVAQKSGSPTSLIQVQEAIGNILLEMQEYPKALPHFQKAVEVARKIQSPALPYELNYTALAFANLGDAGSAESVLSSISADDLKDPDIALGVHNTRATVALAQGNFQSALHETPLMRAAHVEPSAQISSTEAWAHLLARDQPAAAQSAEEALRLAAKDNDKEELSEAQLVLAAAIVEQDPMKACEAASAALKRFEEAGKRHSQLIALIILSQAANRMHRITELNDYLSRTQALQADLRRDWGETTFQMFDSRADLRRISLAVNGM